MNMSSPLDQYGDLPPDYTMMLPHPGPYARPLDTTLWLRQDETVRGRIKILREQGPMDLSGRYNKHQHQDVTTFSELHAQRQKLLAEERSVSGMMDRMEGASYGFPPASSRHLDTSSSRLHQDEAVLRLVKSLQEQQGRPMNLSGGLSCAPARCHYFVGIGCAAVKAACGGTIGVASHDEPNGRCIL
jgi:hypothetical protein